MGNKQNTFVCPVCGLAKPRNEGRAAELVHGPVAELIKKDHPDWETGRIICLSCLNRYRTEYVEDALEEQRGNLSYDERRNGKRASAVELYIFRASCQSSNGKRAFTCKERGSRRCVNYINDKRTITCQ